MKNAKFFISLVLTLTVLAAQVGAVFAAPALQELSPVRGAVQSITLETDINTGVTIVILSVLNENGLSKTVRIGLETATKFGVITLDGDGNPSINTSLLGQSVEIDNMALILDREEDQHPIGSALAAFFSDIAGIDYETIMAAYDEGTGFGVIAQALWLTTKLEGDAKVFEAILEAKQSGDYGVFILEDGTEPKNWGQLRKAILESGKKDNPGLVMSDKDNGNSNGNSNSIGNGNSEENKNDTRKEKEKTNNGNGNGNK